MKKYRMTLRVFNPPWFFFRERYMQAWAAELLKLSEEGWEPFAATPETLWSNYTVFFKKEI